MDPILSSILGPVCQRVMDAAIEEYRLVRGVKEEIRNLQTTVSMIRGVLEDAERKKVEHDAIRIWLKRLKQVLFDAEDVFDEIATEEALERDAGDGTTRCAIVTRRLSKVRSKLVSCLCSVDHISTRRAIAHRVKDINKKFDDISKLKNSLGLIHVSDETSLSVVRPIRRQEETSLLPIGGTRFIGRDNEMREIKGLLLENFVEGTEETSCKKNVHVINVVGMGGVGKTTLVRHAYNDTEVGNYFQLRMWVCVSNYFDLKRVTSKIIDAATSTFTSLPEDCNWDVVQNRLRVLIEGKRFLLVLDDVWEENRTNWDSLCTPLSYGARGSKIIVTTRSQIVSNITKGTSIFLKDLPSDDLWTILKNHAFDGHDPDMQLAQVGREIVQKLKGSPLAARTIGRVLNANLDVGHWTNILSSKAWVSSDSEGSILPILKLSYDHLPGHLKQCFALCSLFPEDHRFVKDELVQLWTAHQLIQIKEGFFHVGSEGGVYLDKLVHMSLFEKYTDYDDQERFVMHDLIHNLADSVSKDDCLRLEDNRQNGTIPETIRHVSIASDKFDRPKIEQLCNKYRNMRTLLFLRGCPFQLEPHLHNIFMKLQRLRVLRLSRCDIKKLPSSIGALKHLRLLDLFDNRISKLPESLCKLRNLQVLKLDSYTLRGALPPNTCALVNLRQLITATVVVPKNISLKTLTAESCSPKQIATLLRQVSSLQELYIEKCPQLRCFGAGDDDDTTINAGDLDVDVDLDLEGVLVDLAPSLRELYLADCSNLSSLPSKLRSLTRLERLEIRHCPKIQRLPSAGLPRTLKELNIISCPNITSLDDGLRSLLGGATGLVSLESLSIRDCPKLLNLVEEEGGAAAAAVMSSSPVLLPSSSSSPPSSSSSPVVVVPKKIISLKTLWAGLCSPKQIATWLRQVSSLQELNIWDCPQLRCFGAGDDDDTTINGGDLDLEGALLDLAPSLRELTLRSCENLSSLPSKLRSLARLETLRIVNCPKIQRLPWAGLPETLKELVIRGCPELEERCREEGCPDWPLLSHIPEVQIQGYRG